MYDFVILIGIPIDREEYISRIHESDYLRLYRSNPDVNWRFSYEKLVAKPFRDLACKAKKMNNFEIRTKATLEDLREVSKTAKVIVLISHWKNYSFSNDDFVQPINKNRFSDIASLADELIAQWITESFKENRIGINNTQKSILSNCLKSIKSLWKTDKTIREILEQSLDINIKNELPITEGITKHVESDLKRRTRRRDVLDTIFSELISPGNRLELFDGLHKCSTISESINENFQGVLDLTVCTSTILADSISSYHQYRYRVVQFSKAQTPIWAAATLNATLSLIQCGFEYLDARQQAIQMGRNSINPNK